MSNKENKPKKHVPQRTCVACREVNAKRSLIRLVRTEEGVRVDQTGRLPGRGAYLHDDKECWEKALSKGILARALKTEIRPEDMEALQAFKDQSAQ